MALARLPTPIEPLERPSARLGTELWVKRDDLAGIGLSGNKVRKLDLLLDDARRQGATAVVTTGGIQSNHCRVTAVAARRLGLRPVLLLRGEPPEVPDGNLLLDTILGAAIHWTDEAGYARRDDKMAEIAADLSAQGEVPYVIPEGGSNALGALAFARAGQDLAAQDDGFDAIVCAVGSGGTLAGLALAGLRARIYGIAVCDDRATFRTRVEAIAHEAAPLGLSLGSRWDVVEGFVGRGYALSTPEELRTQVRFARETGLFLDPVYTGKAWLAVEALARDLGGRVLFWHTGGLFGLFGRGAEYTAASAP